MLPEVTQDEARTRLLKKFNIFIHLEGPYQISYLLIISFFVPIAKQLIFHRCSQSGNSAMEKRKETIEY